jgi:hypothetical protein
MRDRTRWNTPTMLLPSMGSRVESVQRISSMEIDLSPAGSETEIMRPGFRMKTSQLPTLASAPIPLSMPSPLSTLRTLKSSTTMPPTTPPPPTLLPPLSYPSRTRTASSLQVTKTSRSMQTSCSLSAWEMSTCTLRTVSRIWVPSTWWMGYPLRWV